jgi:hypothetical protein
MTLEIDTAIGNKVPSPELHRMLIDLRDTTRAIVESMEEIRRKARTEGFNEQQTILLIKCYFGKDSKTKRQLKWLLYEKPRMKEQKKLTEKLASTGQSTNMSMEEEQKEKISIPTDYKVVVSEQVLEEETKELEQQEQEGNEPINEVLEELKPNHANHNIENLKIQLDNSNNKITDLIAQNKNWEEKYKQLEAKIRAFPAAQGNILRTKIVINQLFREILPLKGARVIYANIVIDTSQNKYIKLDPL